jgi:two-component system aerobic respiration control sensor histidine kinase ArcB
MQNLKKNNKLRREKINFDNIIYSIPGCIYWKDKDGIYLGCNQVFLEMAGLTSMEEIIGKDDTQLCWNDQADILRSHDMEVLVTGKSKMFEEEVVSANGTKFTYTVVKAPLMGSKNEIIGIIGTSLDITYRIEYEMQLAKAKEEAEAANRVKTEFLENMRHDIRTPLTGIVGFANIIAEEAKDPRIKEYVENLTASSNTLQDLLNEILEVIRISSRELPLLKKKFDLKGRLNEVIKLNQARALHKQLSLEFKYDENMPTYVIGDSTRVHRIALELITNALNFTDKGSVKLLVQLAQQKENKLIIKMIVEDTGIGIPPDKQEEIFIQFRKLTPSYKGIYKGTGLGLTIIKEFINELDGEIYVESQESKGSKFTCIFPLKAPLLDDEFGSEQTLSPIVEHLPEQLIETQVTAEPKARETTIMGNKSHILFVEDQLLAAKVGTNILASLNCQVDIASDGKTALELFQKNHYDLIFMDIGLPDIDGYEVTKRMRLFELNNEKHVPIIALTAHVGEENKQHCINVGMNAVLSKPLHKDKAKDILNAFIPYREQQDETSEVKKDTDNVLPEDKVIDFELIKQLFGGEEDAGIEVLTMLTSSFLEELSNLQTAYDKADWSAIQSIAHKLKGGSSYCGTVRLKKTCAQLESVINDKKTALYACSYQQALQEIESVKKAFQSLKLSK